MILGVNGIRLVAARSGVARAIEAILRCLGELDHPFRTIRVYSPTPIPEEVRLPAIAESVVVPSRGGPALWEQVALPRAHGQRGLLLCPSYVIPLLARCPTFVIHHGSYEGYPQAFSSWVLNKARVAYALSAWRATGVSTVSEFSRRDMHRYYGISPSRVHVVPEGVDTAIFRPMADRARLTSFRRDYVGGDEPYVAYVGKPTERRNLTPLLHAFARLRRERGLPHKMLIVGAALPGGSPFRQVIRELRLDGDVVVRDYATHEEMPLVYNAADLFIYPSSYEGFGMPVLEAMACGTPTIALDNTAFPEFAGGVAHLLPDAKVDTLLEGMHAVLRDQAWRARMATDGPKRAEAYDWHRVTRRYLDLLIPIAEAAEAHR
ncbi:MAG: glycosyltransferase family 4 protein [Gemmatimonadota bacterium]|nr:glycosyltransferase family 4 protein [Gemmatimonadota bacterium]